MQDCKKFSPSYSAHSHFVTQVDSTVPAMKKYAELGLCGLSMEYQYGGSQLPFYQAILARIPFFVANEALSAPYLNSSNGFVELYDHCFNGLHMTEQDFPDLNKDFIYTHIAHGINYGAVCMSGKTTTGDSTTSEG